MDKNEISTIVWLTKELTQAQEELKNIQAIEKEHQRINGELREENNHLKLMTSYNEYTKGKEKENIELRETNKLLKKQYISLYSNYCEELKRKNGAIEYIEERKKYKGEPFYLDEIQTEILYEKLKGGSDEI